jgi:hypothetical protein
MTAQDSIGYLASLLVLAAFCTCHMVTLRILAIASNLAFVAYALLATIEPVLLLHAFLLPINLLRLRQILRPADSFLFSQPRRFCVKTLKRSIIALCALFAPLIAAQSGWPSTVTVVPPVERGKTVIASGNLSNGLEIPDLSWAWRSSMACFVQTQANKFAAKHVIFATQTKLSGIGELMVKVIPKDPSANLSLWVYASNDYRLPPDIQSVRSCEADFKWDRPFKGQTQDHTRYITMGTKSEGIVIGVSGPKEVTAADFSLEISVK